MTDVEAPPKILRLGVSSCLLGEEVRFNGGHKRDGFLVGTMGQYVEWVPVCPEVEVGMTIPRETVQLRGDADAPNMVAPKSGKDWTAQMRAWSASRLEQLATLDLDGYVLMKNSPSCGLFRVKVYPDGSPMGERKGRGLFAMALTERLPLLPVEENGRLNDPRIRENFLDRLFTYRRFREFATQDGSPKGFVRFHTIHKCTVLAHSPPHYRRLGPIVAKGGRDGLGQRITEYGEILMEAMAVMVTPGKHTNVLEHLAGHVKDRIDDRSRGELHALIHDYRKGLVPLIVPVTLLRHHLAGNDDCAWALDQIYLNPYPRELMLRNHV